MFEEATQAALAEVQGDESNAGESQSDSQLDGPTEVSEAQSEKAQAASAPAKTPAELADLSKMERFKFEGQEMSYDDLRRAYLRHKDYTQKTQALADERKFFDNLSADLRQVKKDPGLAAEFKRVYPEKFHGYLDVILDQQAQAQGQQAVQQQPANTNLPPEVLQELRQHRELLDQMRNESVESQQASLGSLFESMEGRIKDKYPRADLVQSYTMLSDYLEDNGVSAKEILRNPKKYEAEFERLVKASHDYMEKQFVAWEKEKLTKARETNRRASDVGRGSGQAPTSAPQKLKLKDVADAMIAAGPEA